MLRPPFFVVLFWRRLITFGQPQRPDRIPCAFLHWASQCALPATYSTSRNRTRMGAQHGFTHHPQGLVPTMVIAFSVGVRNNSTSAWLSSESLRSPGAGGGETSTPRRSAPLRDPLRPR
ncbi:hypothetical protein LY76DRAFT_245041 [Colletotrichum caudatum]|nr:hypothetical protein LY76DRAFT_245041 [Colletotrichum caudatum]